jgi:ELWxxDGT repeat protein
VSTSALRSLLRLAPLLAAAALANTAAAQEPAFLVEDVNPTYTEQDSNPTGFTRVGTRLFFAASSSLWVVDAPALAPRRIEAAFHDPEPLLAFDGRLLFTASDGVWISDGSDAGTERLTTQTVPSASFADGGRVAVLATHAYFVTSEIPGGRALWRTDGTPAGTERVALLGLAPGDGDVEHLLVFGGALYFVTNVLPAGTLVASADLWTSDGTELGTQVVKSFSGPCCRDVVRGLAVSGGRLYVASYGDGGGFVLWTSDGTGPGTQPLLELATGPFPSFDPRMADANGTLFFTAPQLWRTDGTVPNTVQITDLGTHPTLGLDRLVALGDGAFFRRRLPDGSPELWFSDGTPDAAVPLGSFTAAGLVAGATHAWFGQAGALWRSDGSVAGTIPVAAGFASGPAAIRPDGDGVYFAAEGPEGLGVEPWLYDPDGGFAALVADVAPALPNSFCGSFFVCHATLAALGDEVLFPATETGSGFDLWRSDGTPAGTLPILEADATPLGALGDVLLLRAGLSGGELWRTDGTAGGTFEVKDIHPGPQGSFPAGPFPALDGFAYFTAYDGTHGIELWRTDASEPGTTLVKDVWPGDEGSEPARLFVWGDRLVFTADDGVSGREPWLSDGTEPGTARLIDIAPGSASSDPERYNALGDLLFFAARDAQGVELWTSDGTEGGTARLVDLWPGPESSDPRLLRPLGDQVLFAASDPDHGEELWRSDGTAPGTALLADLVPGPDGSSPEELVVAGDRVFFLAGAADARGLAVSQGTPVTTGFVIPPGDPAAPEHPGRLFPVGSKVLFTAGAASAPALFGLLSEEIWVSDGTAPGTHPLAEVAIPIGAPGDAIFETAGDFVFFTGYDDAHGHELWALPLAAVVPEPGAGALAAAAALALAGLRAPRPISSLPRASHPTRAGVEGPGRRGRR